MQRASVATSLVDLDGLGDLEACLSARTKVPAERLGDIMQWPDERVRREADLVTRMLRRFAGAVVSAMENPASAHEFLRALDLKTVSRDHDWRAIFATMRDRAAGEGARERAALVKYLQYLRFRKRLLEFIYARRQGLEETDSFTELAPMASRSLVRPGALDAFERLPMGETVELRLRESASIEILLAAHVFHITGGRPPSLVDRNGASCVVQPGRNMVGRHPESDIVVDGRFSDVSRAHILLDWAGDERLRLTDLSTRGTSLRRRVIQRGARFVALG